MLIPQRLLLNLPDLALKFLNVVALSECLFLFGDCALIHGVLLMHQVLHAHLEDAHGMHAFMRDPHASLLLTHVTVSKVVQVLPQQGVDLGERRGF